MALSYRSPGVYLEESPFNNPPADVGGSQSQAVFIGASSKGPINQPVAIQSWSDYVARFGGFNKIANVSGGPSSKNNVYVSKPNALGAITGPRLGDVAFVNDYRYNASRFFLHNAGDYAASASGYFQPHSMMIYCGGAMGWQDTGFDLHTENGFFGASGAAYSASSLTFGNGANIIRGDSNYTCNFFMSSSGGDVPTFQGSATPLDIGLHWNTTADQWSLWMYGTTNYWFSPSGATKGQFQTGSSQYSPFVNNAWNKIDVTFQQNVQASAAPPGADWSLFTCNTSTNTSGRETYVTLQDMPGPSAGQFANINWAGWSPDLSGPTSGTVTALPYLPYAVNSYFQNGGKNAWVVRSVSTTEAGVASSVDYTTGGSGTNVCYTVEAVGSGTWGDDISVNMTVVAQDQGQEIFSARVLLNGTEVERFPNLTMSGTLPGTKRVDQAINDPSVGSRYIQIVGFDDQSIPVLDAANVPRDLSGGSDPNLPSALDLVTSAADTVTSIDGSLLVNIVGHTTNPTDPSAFVYPTTLSSSQIVGNSGRTNVFTINDACPPRPQNKSAQDYIGQEIQSTLISQSSTDSYVASYTPWIVVPDPAVPGGTLLVPPGGAVAGIFARTDATVGVFQTPAGVSTGSITNALGVDTKFTDSQLGQLNSDNINVIRSVQGSGMCVMGARTRKKYGVDQYIAPRRTLIYIEETLTAATQFAVFQNNDQRLWAKLSMTADRILRPLWNAGGLAGTSTAEAYFIKCDGTVNLPSVVASGEVRMEVGVALEYPAEFVVITVSQFDGTTFTTEVQPTA